MPVPVQGVVPPVGSSIALLSLCLCVLLCGASLSFFFFWLQFFHEDCLPRRSVEEAAAAAATPEPAVEGADQGQGAEEVESDSDVDVDVHVLELFCKLKG